MGAYTGTPTVLASWEVGDRNGKFVRACRRLSIVLSSQGGATNNITAVALGFTAGNLQMVRPVLFTDGGSVKRAVWLFTDGTLCLVGSPIDATDATRGAAADVTGTLILEAEGLV